MQTAYYTSAVSKAHRYEDQYVINNGNCVILPGLYSIINY